MHTLDPSLAELFTPFHILPTSQMSIIKSGNVCQREECIRGCPLPCDHFTKVRRLQSRLPVKTAGQVFIEWGLHLDASEEGGTADQSTRVNVVIDPEEAGQLTRDGAE